MTLFLSGCTTSSVIPIGDDLYRVSSSGAGFSDGSVTENVFNAAKSFCSKNGKKLKKVNFDSRRGKLGAHPPSAELQFKCADDVTEKQMNIANNKAGMCLIKNAIMYDDGGQVKELSQLVSRKCYNVCTLDRANLFTETKAAYSEACTEEAADIIYEQRRIKRDGGDAHQYNDLTFIKNRGDGFFSINLQTLDDTGDVRFILACTNGDGLNTHSLKLSDTIFNQLDIPSQDKVNLSINGIQKMFFKNQDGFVQTPLLDVKNHLNTNEVVISADNKSVRFNLNGFKDGIARMVKECPSIK